MRTANITRTVTQNGQTHTVDYTTTRAGVIEIVRHCKAAHINTIVVDVKPLSGQVLYNSKVAPHMTTWKGHPSPISMCLPPSWKRGTKPDCRWTPA